MQFNFYFMGCKYSQKGDKKVRDTENKSIGSVAVWTVILMKVVKKINVYCKLNSPSWLALNNFRRQHQSLHFKVIENSDDERGG